MPRKIWQLKSDLRRAGFVEQKNRGKGSHARRYHPETPEAYVHVAGHDGYDAYPYKERDARQAISLERTDDSRSSR